MPDTFCLSLNVTPPHCRAFTNSSSYHQRACAFLMIPSRFLCSSGLYHWYPGRGIYNSSLAPAVWFWALVHNLNLNLNLSGTSPRGTCLIRAAPLWDSPYLFQAPRVAANTLLCKLNVCITRRRRYPQPRPSTAPASRTTCQIRDGNALPPPAGTELRVLHNLQLSCQCVVKQRDRIFGFRESNPLPQTFSSLHCGQRQEILGCTCTILCLLVPDQ